MNPAQRHVRPILSVLLFLATGFVEPSEAGTVDDLFEVPDLTCEHFDEP